MAEEKNFENKVKGFLETEKCYYFKYWGGGQFTKAGIPDIIACCNGKFVAIEVKASKGKPSKLQIYNLKAIDDAGGFAVLLYPNQYELFKNFIYCMKVNDPNMYVNYELLKERWMNGT